MSLALNVREDFPQLTQKVHGKPLIYLDSAATALKPRCVIEAIHRFYSEEYGTVHRAVYHLAAQSTERYYRARCTVQRFLGAERPEEIVFTKGTTEAINLVAASYGEAFIREGDEIALPEIEHHANLVPWYLLCKRKKAILKTLPVNDQGELIWEEAKRLITPKTKLVALAHISNVIGTHHSIEQVITHAHQMGAKVLIDGAQSAPHLPLDVRILDADFFVFSGHKTYGPTGVGVLYGKKELLDAMPPYQGGGDMIDRVSFEEITFQETPLKFEAGTPMIAEVIGLAAALDYLNSLGREAIAAWEQELLCYATEQLSSISRVRLIGTAAHKGPILSFVISGAHPLDIGTLLDTQGIAVRTGNQCAQTAMKRFGISSLIRASFGCYNTLEEIDQFADALRTLLRKF